MLSMAQDGLRWILGLVSLLSHRLTKATDPGPSQEVCLLETFHAVCAETHAILIQSALYGRMNIGRCAPVNYGNMGCQTDVVGYFDGLCSGRQECDVRVPDEHLLAFNVCPQGVTPYLEAAYTCIPILSGRQYRHECNTKGVVLVSGHTEGSITSASLATRHASSRICPWVIEAKPGQRINVTLLDFGTAQAATHSNDEHRPSCMIYATLTEEALVNPTTVCSGTRRERHVYFSRSYRLEIRFADLRGSQDSPNFLIKYSVVGCGDPELNGHTLVERTADKAVLRCGANDGMLTLNCIGATWDIAVDVCIPVSTENVWNTLSGKGKSGQGIGLVVGAGIVLGTLIGLSFLLCLLIWLYFRRDNSENERPESVYLEDDKVREENKVAYKWDAETGDFVDLDGDPFGRSGVLSGRYAHACKPAGRDVFVMEPQGLPMESTSAESKPNDVPSASMDTDNVDTREYIYERPL